LNSTDTLERLNGRYFALTPHGLTDVLIE